MSTPAPAETAPQRSDVFISYSRKDREFVKRLEEVLESRGRETWVDWQGIRPAEEFLQAIFPAIEGTDTFVFVLSPDSVTSEICGKELAHAVSHNKRMIPIMARDTDAKAVPEPLAKLNWVFARDADNFEAAADFLISALDTDLGWVRAHTRLLTRALEWEAKAKSNSFVLRGEDLSAAEQWLAQAGTEKERQPTALQTEYIIASRKAAARRQRITLGAVSFGLVLAIVLAILALFQRAKAVEQRTVAVARQLAAQAELVRNQGRHQIDRSVLLAVESLKRVPTLEADLVLRPQLRLLPRPGAVISVGGEIYQTASSADGRYLATSTAESVSVWEIPSGKSVAVLPATFPVATMAFSPDGSRLATGSGAITSQPDTYMAQVWDLQDEREVARILNSSPVDQVAFNADGKYLATADGLGMGASKTSHARVWEVATGKPILEAPHEATVVSIALSPDGRRLATQTNRRLNQIWSVEQKEVEPESKVDSPLYGVAFSPDWTRQAMTDGSTLRIVETETGRELALIKEPDVEKPRFVAGGEWVIAAARGDAKIVWNAADGEEIVRLNKAGEVADVAVSPDHRYLATCSRDNVAQIWDLNGEEVSRLVHESVKTLSFTADGRHLVTADILGSVRVWETTAGREVATFRHERDVAEIAYSPDGQYLVTNSDDRSLRIWEVNTGREITRVPSEYGVRSFAFSPDWKILAVAVERETRLLETLTGRDLARLNMTEGVGQLVFSPDGRELATAGFDKVVRVWEVASGREVATLPLEASIAFRPDGTCLAASSDSGTALVRNVKTGREIVRIENKEIEAIGFSPDGRYLCATVSGAIILLDPVTGREIQRLSHHSLTPLTFSRDGKYLATGAADGSALVWRISDGQMLSRLPHRGGFTAVNFNHDGTRLLTGSLDGAARLLNLRTGREVSRMQSPAGILAMAISPDGRYLATGSRDGAVHIWYLNSADLIGEACLRLQRNLTREEWEQFVGDEPYAATCPNLPAAP